MIFKEFSGQYKAVISRYDNEYDIDVRYNYYPIEIRTSDNPGNPAFIEIEEVDNLQLTESEIERLEKEIMHFLNQEPWNYV